MKYRRPTERVILRTISGPDAARSYWAVEPGPGATPSRYAGCTFSTDAVTLPTGVMLLGVRLPADIVPPETPGGKAYTFEFCYQAEGSLKSLPAELMLPVARVVDVLPPHEFRAAQERKELGERIDRLREFSRTPEHAALDHMDRQLLEMQLAHMTIYYEVLGLRQQHWARKAAA